MDVDAAVEEMVYQYVSGVMDVDAAVENRTSLRRDVLRDGPTSLEFRFVSITGNDAWDVAMARYYFTNLATDLWLCVHPAVPTTVAFRKWKRHSDVDIAC
jgi:hypothetical protein